VTTPPPECSPPQKALWWLKQGNFKLGAAWDQAHGICQTAEGTYEYDLVHALAHWIEGDNANRDYWYRRAGDTGRASSVEQEWARINTILATALRDATTMFLSMPTPKSVVPFGSRNSI
jgi:hypothetical protein